MVHAFVGGGDGGVVSVTWEEAYFHLGHGYREKYLRDIQVHVPCGGGEIASGSTPQLLLEPSKDAEGLHSARIEVPIENKYNAVRLVYSIFEAGEPQPLAQGEVWEED